METIFRNSSEVIIVKSPGTVRRNLVFIRAGSGNPWPFRGERNTPTRDFDIAVSYYEAPDEDSLLYKNADYVLGGGLSKFHAAQKFLQGSKLLDAYGFIFFVDDDIEFLFSVDKFINFCAAQNMTITQPALTHDSFFTFQITRHHPGTVYRTTNYIETMCPLIATSYLKTVIGAFNQSISTYGLDVYWSSRLKEHETAAIIDLFQMRHTRPISDDGRFYRYLLSIGINRWDELSAMLKSLNILEYKIKPKGFVFLEDKISALDIRGAGFAAVAASQPGVRVIIYGRHSQDWMAALAPGAAVWKAIPSVKEVLHIADTPDARIPPERPGLRNVIIPLMEPHIKNCPPGHASLIPDAHSVDIFGNKAAFAAYVEANDLSHHCPETFQDISKARFPCVVKRLELNGGEGVAIAYSRKELETFLTMPPWRGHEVTLQEFILGDSEYVVHCLCKNGEVLWHTAFTYTMGSPASVRTPHNVQAIRPITPTAETMAAIDAILKPIGYNGPCNVCYKHATPERAAIFEINPRLGGSLMRPANVASLADMLSCIISNALDHGNSHDGMTGRTNESGFTPAGNPVPTNTARRYHN